MRKVTRSTKDARIVAIVIGLFVTGFISSLWVFHVFLGGLGRSNISTPATFAYGFIYAIFSAVGYRTFLYDGMASYEESFIFFNVVPALLVAMAWGVLYFFGVLS